MVHLGFASFDIICETWNSGDDFSEDYRDVDCKDCLKQKYAALKSRADAIQTRLCQLEMIEK